MNQGKPFYQRTPFLVVLAILVVAVIVIASRRNGNDVGTDSATKGSATQSEQTKKSEEDQFGMDTRDVRDVKKTIPGDHIYSESVIKPICTGTQEKSMGRYSVVKAKSKDCTKKALTDWYFNYVLKYKYNYCIILYTDKEGEGCYSVKGLVFKDTKIVKKQGKVYYLGSSAGATAFVPSDDGKKLVENPS